MKTPFSLCLLLLLFLAVQLPAQRMKQTNQKSIDTHNLEQRINSLVTAKVKELNIPGYSLAVVYQGKTVIQRGYGFADIENKKAATPDHVFGLASVTKTFTGLLTLILVEEGKIKLDDPLSKYYDNLSIDYQKITIRQLASMTGGVPSFVKENVGWEQQIKNAQTQPLESRPGTSFSYSNLSYRLLGGIIEKASGRSYMDLLQEKILSPLSMTNTKPTDQNFEDLLAIPYNEKGEALKYKQPSINFAAGMLASNTKDMVNYAQALLDGKFLSPNGYKILWEEREKVIDSDKNKESNWAFGWGSSGQNGHFMVGMNGGLPGVASTILIYPDDELIIIGLSNMRAGGHDVTRVVANEVLGN